MTFTPASTALSHYRVLDLTRARAGPTAARQLADFGADVIKIEMPGDPQYSDFGTRHGPDFQNLHRNKRGMTLNLKTDEGKEIFMRLVEKADVVVENYRPDVKFRLGIDYHALKAINPGIVYASISGFGQDGPYASRPGLDQVAQGMGGHMSVTGEPGSGPWRSGAAIADMTAGMLTATGILTALLEREKSGEGQWLHTSLLEGQIFLLDFQAARWLVGGEVPPQAGNNHPTNIPTGTFRTQDGYVNIAPMPAHWDRLCKAMEMEHLQDHPDYATREARLQNRDTLNPRIQEIALTKTTKEWVEILNDASVPSGPIYNMEEVFEDAQVKHVGIAQTIDSPTRGPTTIVGQPVHLDRTPNKLTSPSPELGEHTAEVLAELGYDEAGLEDLRTRQVI